MKELSSEEEKPINTSYEQVPYDFGAEDGGDNYEGRKFVTFLFDKLLFSGMDVVCYVKHFLFFLEDEETFMTDHEQGIKSLKGVH